jgi:hypothetical protein
MQWTNTVKTNAIPRGQGLARGQGQDPQDQGQTFEVKVAKFCPQ